MKRQANSNGAVGRDLDIGSRPVETVQRAEVNKATEVHIPRAQGVWVALPLSVAVGVTILSPIALGPRIFWATCGVMALAAFLWSVQFEMQWLDRVSLPFLVGLTMWCFWRFTDWQGWRVPESWQPLSAVFSIISLVFWWTFTGAMWLTFWQRLGMPMYHQQYSVWRAVGNLIEFFGKKERQVVQVAPDPRQISFEFKHNGGHIRHNVQPPVDDETLTWVCRILQEETFSEASLCGPDKPLPGGQRGREHLAVLRDWLIQWDIMRWNRTNGDGEPIVTQGVTLTADGLRWVEEVGKYDNQS